MRRTLIAFIAMQLALGFGARWGMAQENVEELARRGAELFQQGQFREAAQLLLQAYNLEPVPVLLYNIARAYQQDGRCAAASEFFQRYIQSGDTQALEQAQTHEPGETQCAQEYQGLISQANDALNSGQLDQAEQVIHQALERSDEPNARIMYEQTLFHLGRCEEARDYINNVQAEIDFSDTEHGELERDLDRANQCVADRQCADQRTACEDENARRTEEAQGAGKSRRTIAYIVGGVGAAVLIGAVIHDAVSQSTIDDYENAALHGDVAQYNSLRDDIDSAKTLSFILYGVGIAGVVTGVVLFFTAPSGEPADLQDCDALCWDWGFGSATGDPGVWLGGSF